MAAYRNFQQLQENETLGLDYRIRWRDGSSGIVVMAPRGGGIEPGTTEIDSYFRIARMPCTLELSGIGITFCVSGVIYRIRSRQRLYEDSAKIMKIRDYLLKRCFLHSFSNSPKFFP